MFLRRFGSRIDAPSCARSRRHRDNRVPAGRSAPAGTVRHRRRRALSRRGKEPAYFLPSLYQATSLHDRGRCRWWRHRVTWRRVTSALSRCAALRAACRHSVLTATINWCNLSSTITTTIIIISSSSSSSSSRFLHKQTVTRQIKRRSIAPKYRHSVQAVSESGQMTSPFTSRNASL